MKDSPLEKILKQAWQEFRDYARKEMGYTNKQNLNECLNGAGAFVDYLLGRKPVMGTSYATNQDWPRGE